MERSGALYPQCRGKKTQPEMCRYSAMAGWRCHVQGASPKASRRYLRYGYKHPVTRARTALAAFFNGIALKLSLSANVY